MKKILLVCLAVLSINAFANQPSTAMSSEVYDMLASKVYWENKVGENPVPQIDTCFEKGRGKSKSGKSLLQYVDTCMDKKGFTKKQLAHNH